MTCTIESYSCIAGICYRVKDVCGKILSEGFTSYTAAQNYANGNSSCTMNVCLTCTGSTPHFSSGCALLLHYDADRDGIINQTEASTALNDYLFNGVLTQEEAQFVTDAYNAGSSIVSVCPGCTHPPSVTCTGSTPHFASGCALLLHYDADKDGIINDTELLKATDDQAVGLITAEEVQFIISAWSAGGSILLACPGCVSCTTPGCGFVVA